MDAEGARPLATASSSRGASVLPDQPLLSWGSGHSQAQYGEELRPGQRVDRHRLNLPGPQHFPKGRISTSEHPVSQEKWPVACANISTGENASPAEEAKLRLAVKNGWETNGPSTA